MSEPATQQDIQNLRHDLAELKADTRDAYNQHRDEDRMEFSRLSEEMSKVRDIVTGWQANLGLSRWLVASGMLGNFALLLVYVVKHW